jgi:hypothetical protein
MADFGSPDWNRSAGIGYSNIVNIVSNPSLPAFTSNFLTPTGLQATGFFYKVLVGSSIEVSLLSAVGNFQIKLFWCITPNSSVGALTKTYDVQGGTLQGWIEPNLTTTLAILLTTDGGGLTGIRAVINKGFPAVNRSPALNDGIILAVDTTAFPPGETIFTAPPYHGPAMFSAELNTPDTTKFDARIDSLAFGGLVLANAPWFQATAVTNGAGALILPTLVYLPTKVNRLHIGNRTGGALNGSFSFIALRP